MDTTTFLSAVWGPILLVVGIGILTSRSYYTKIYRDLEKSPLAVLTFGIFAMSVGIVQVLGHNDWSTTTAGIISFLGFATLVKGTLFLLAPKFVDTAGDTWARMKLLPVAALLSLLVGVYLTWFAYFG